MFCSLSVALSEEVNSEVRVGLSYFELRFCGMEVVVALARRAVYVYTYFTRMEVALIWRSESVQRTGQGWKGEG